MFSRKDIKFYVEVANLPDHADKNVLYASLSNKERQNILFNNISVEEQRIAAAIEIQRIWKGYRTRSMIHSILHTVENMPPSHHPSYLDYPSRSFMSTSSVSELRDAMNQSRLSMRLQSSILKRKSKLVVSYESYYEQAVHTNKVDKEKLLTFQGFCAYTIQSWWKECQAKQASRRNENLLIKPSSIVVKKATYRQLNETEAATLVQRAWRRHIDVQVFDYYKKLINFQSQCDPQYMLRSINPKEADLMDTTGYLHLRFRLGGTKFPPVIYYKIYSNINVADVGSFAPRNYTHTSTKQLPGKYLHSRGLETNGSSDEEEWYSRFENNGWRQVSDKILLQMREDPVESLTSQKKIDYHFDKLVRQQDLAAKKKRKKLNWMKKMYSMGVLKVRGNEEESVQKLVHTAAESLFTGMDDMRDEEIEHIDDWEVDELLQWTQGLNFDSYAEDWIGTGTARLKRVQNDKGLTMDGV